MDLPGDIKNAVYSYLLTFSTKNNDSSGLARHCYPGILRTCRTINHEASRLLYASNTIQIVVYAEWRFDCTSDAGGSVRKLFKSVTIHNHKVHDAEQTSFEIIPDGMMAWPTYLRRVRKLSLKLQLVQEQQCNHDHGTTAFAVGCISTLVAFFMRKHCLVDLDVIGSSPSYLVVGVNGALAQLCRLRSIERIVSIRGPDKWLARDLRRAMRKPGGITLNIIEDMKRVFDEADALKAMQVSRDELTRHDNTPAVRDLVSKTMALIDYHRRCVLWTLSAELGVSQSKDWHIYMLLEAMHNAIAGVEKHV